MKLYQYNKCGSCRKAANWMTKNEIKFDSLPIRDCPPSREELRALLDSHNGQIKKLFNTSSRDYRVTEIKERIPSMTEEEIIELLHQNGNLNKRPILLGPGIFLQGFNEVAWAAALLNNP
tara:strand:- start:466 stop:825 length:360 start_codon:yes stop_codon:yes gene_type:complete